MPRYICYTEMEEGRICDNPSCLVVLRFDMMRALLADVRVWKAARDDYISFFDLDGKLATLRKQLLHLWQ